MPSLATALGTPRAESWDAAWLAVVGQTEQRLARRICGAHAPDGEPCELGSTHPNGRCRFHGGHPRIGAQPGNTNALVHGLYSRRLRQCNDTCPVWRMCPFAGPDVTALSERKRPVCAYEREAYAIAMQIPQMEWNPGRLGGVSAAELDSEVRDAGIPACNSADQSPFGPLPQGLSATVPSARENLVTQLRYRATPFFGKRGTATKFPRNEINATDPAISPSDPSISSPPFFPSAPPPDPTPGMIADTGAILYAMLQRATLTVSAHELTEKTEANGERYTFRSTKMSAALTAFLRIGRELRAWLKLRHAPAESTDTPANNGFGDNIDRAEFSKEGYVQFYNHKGDKIPFPSLMHPFLHELDAAVEQLRQEGIEVPPPKPLTA